MCCFGRVDVESSKETNNGSICLYYLFLFLSDLLFREMRKKEKKKKEEAAGKREKREEKERKEKKEGQNEKQEREKREQRKEPSVGEEDIHAFSI